MSTTLTLIFTIATTLILEYSSYSLSYSYSGPSSNHINLTFSPKTFLDLSKTTTTQTHSPISLRLSPIEGTLIRTLKLDNFTRVYSMQALRDGLLASTSQLVIKIWNPSTGELLRTLYRHTRDITCLKMLNDGSLASGSYDKAIFIWNPYKGQLLRNLSGHTEGVKAFEILNDGNLVSGSLDQTIKIWNTKTGLWFIAVY